MSDWDAWNQRSLAGEPIVRLILDGTVVQVRDGAAAAERQWPRSVALLSRGC